MNRVCFVFVKIYVSNFVLVFPLCYAENGMYVVCDGFYYVFFFTVIFGAVALTPEYNEFVPSSSFDFLFDIENYVKRTGGALFCVLGGAV